jgi:hypothetical protein
MSKTIDKYVQYQQLKTTEFNMFANDVREEQIKEDFEI